MMKRIDAPSDQKSLPSLTKFPSSPVKNTSLKGRANLKLLDTKKFRIDSIYKLPNGPRLPALLAETGLENVQLNIVQPAGTDGEIKFSTPLTMENIASAVLAEGLASPAEVTQLVAELYEFAHTPGSVGCMPRVVEAWGYRAKVPN